jgi:hypothetical protein
VGEKRGAIPSPVVYDFMLVTNISFLFYFTFGGRRLLGIELFEHHSFSPFLMFDVHSLDFYLPLLYSVDYILSFHLYTHAGLVSLFLLLIFLFFSLFSFGFSVYGDEWAICLCSYQEYQPVYLATV